MSDFISEFLKKSQEKDSRLIFSADTENWQRLIRILDTCNGNMAAIKVHPEYPLIWGFSHQEAVNKLKSISNNLPIILDAKLADIDKSNEMKAKFYFEQGYDAIICHGFSGEDALKPVVNLANNLSKGVLLLVSMSSRNNLFTHNETNELVKMAKNLDVTGVVAPGNQYDVLAQVRRLLGKNKLIISPGIGAQGGDLEKAMLYTDFAIVGRGIIESTNPEHETLFIKKKINAVLLKRAEPKEKEIDSQLVELLLLQNVLKFGDFTLKSGRKSTYFFTTGNLDNGLSITKVAESYANAISDYDLMDKFDVIFGPAYKGIPLATAIADALYRLYNVNKRFAYDRKEAKGHGDTSEQVIVGNMRSTDRILLVDDVITTGKTKIATLEKIKAIYPHAEFTGLLILFDRQEKDEHGNNPIDELRKTGLSVYSILQARSLFGYLKGREINNNIPVTDELYSKFEKHQAEYGTKG